MATNWMTEFITRLKQQKTRTDQQELIVILYEKTVRTKSDEMELQVLLKAERARERLKMAEARAARLLGTRKNEARKARNHRLIQQGLLIDNAGLEGRSRGEILGGLLIMAKSTQEMWAQFKVFGDALLSLKEEKTMATERRG